MRIAGAERAVVDDAKIRDNLFSPEHPVGSYILGKDVSYDLQVWATSQVELPIALPEPELWREEGGVWVRGKHAWQVVVGPQHRVDLEDIPFDVHAALPGVGYMIEVSLEPTAATQSAYSLLRRTAKMLASAAHGAVLDQQTATVTTPSGVQRYVRPEPSETVDVLELSWFAMNDITGSRPWFDALVRLFERNLPEALPVRYGQYEPPAHRLRECGRDHLVDFLVEEHRNGGMVVWHPKRPILHLHLSLGSGASWQGWRAQRITMDVEAAVLKQPGWATTLQHLWRRVAHLCQVYYADVRILRNQRVGGSTVDQLREADHHPVCSWWWAGIPRNGGVAVALGEPYRSLWPEFVSAAEPDRELSVLSGIDWREDENVFDRIGGVPEALVTQSPAYLTRGWGPNLDRVYPPVWPFGPTHSRRPGGAA